MGLLSITHLCWLHFLVVCFWYRNHTKLHTHRFICIQYSPTYIWFESDTTCSKPRAASPVFFQDSKPKPDLHGLLWISPGSRVLLKGAEASRAWGQLVGHCRDPRLRQGAQQQHRSRPWFGRACLSSVLFRSLLSNSVPVTAVKIMWSDPQQQST